MGLAQTMWSVGVTDHRVVAGCTDRCSIEWGLRRITLVYEDSEELTPAHQSNKRFRSSSRSIFKWSATSPRMAASVPTFKELCAGIVTW